MVKVSMAFSGDKGALRGRLGIQALDLIDAAGRRVGIEFIRDRLDHRPDLLVGVGVYGTSLAEDAGFALGLRYALKKEPGDDLRELAEVEWRGSSGSSRWSNIQAIPIETWLARRLRELLAQPGQFAWHRSSERLLGEIERLLNEHERLLRRLHLAYRDLDVALAKITQLEAARDQLREERYGVKGWTSPAMLVAIATLIVTGLAGLPAWTADDEDPETTAPSVTAVINTTIEIANEVIVDCGGVPPTIPETE